MGLESLKMVRSGNPQNKTHGKPFTTFFYIEVSTTYHVEGFITVMNDYDQYAPVSNLESMVDTSFNHIKSMNSKSTSS